MQMIRALGVLSVAVAGLALASCTAPKPAVDPSQPLCSGQPVYVGFYCCNDGYPGECQLSELCYAPDECREAPGPNDPGGFSARRTHKRAGL